MLSAYSGYNDIGLCISSVGDKIPPNVGSSLPINMESYTKRLPCLTVYSLGVNVSKK